MAKFAKIGQNYYTVGERNELQQISESDIIGRAGDAYSGGIQGMLASGDLINIDPSKLQPQYLAPRGDRPQGAYSLGFSLGGSDAYVYNEATLNALGIPKALAPNVTPGGQVSVNQDFAQYLGSTGQAYNPQTGFSGAPGIQSTQQFQQGVQAGTIDANTGQAVVKEALDKLYDAGYKINPNAQIGATSIDEFLTIAGKEISPFYADKLKIISDDLKRNLGYSQQQIIDSESALEQKYGRSLRDIASSASERGFAQSGIRKLEEQNLQKETEQAIEQGRRQLQFQASGAVSQFSRQFTGLPGFQLPGANVGEAPRALAGQEQFQRTGRELPFYELSDSVYQGLTGSEEFARRGAIRTRASELEEAQRLGQSLPTRTLSL